MAIQSEPRQRPVAANYANIPGELKERRQWVVWRLEPDEKRGGKLTKRLYNVFTGKLAKTNDPDTWASFADAIKAATKGRYNGIGYVFASDDPCTGIDLDHCRNSETGEIAKWAALLLSQLNSYAEISQSGTGVHVIVRASLDPLRSAGTIPTEMTGKRRDDIPETNGGGLEIYDCRRFFAITGNRLEDFPSTIADRQEDVLAVFTDYLLPAPAANPSQKSNAAPAIASNSDTAIIDRISHSKQGAKFDRLMRGDVSSYGDDESRADQALADIIAFYTRDTARIESIFNQSELARREKWQDRADYRKATINAALQFVKSQAKAGQFQTRRVENGDDEGDESPIYPYKADHRGFFYVKKIGSGENAAEIDIPLSNFTARITRDITEDDGSGELKRLFEIVATLRGRDYSMTVPSSQFSSLSWVLDKIGGRARWETGQSVKEHVRNAIQRLSEDGMIDSRVFTHTGWRRLDSGEWVYLHGAGAIHSKIASQSSQSSQNQKSQTDYNRTAIDSAQQEGPQEREREISQISQISQSDIYSSLSVSLSGAGCIDQFTFPSVTSQDDTIAAVRQSLTLLDVAPDSVTAPLLCAVWRAPLGECDFSLHLSGQSGALKSSLAAVFQSFYGAGMHDHLTLPANWESTAAYLEYQTFRAKDALLVIDEFKPKGTQQDIARYHAKADTIFRASGNGASRGRMRANMEAQASRKPRCLVVSTGEDNPNTGSDSLAARVLLLSVAKGDVRPDLLRFAQRSASEGMHARAMAGYLSWLASRYDSVSTELAAISSELADQAAIDSHARTPRIIGNLASGFRCFLNYAQSIGAISKSDAAALWSRVWDALIASGQSQRQEQQSSNPINRFAELLVSAFTQSKAHLDPLHGNLDPERFAAYGWDDVTAAMHGDLIGWLDGDDIYLEPGAAYAAAHRIAREQGTNFVTSESMLWRFLAESGTLKSTDAARKTPKARKYINGKQIAVIHVDAQYIYPSVQSTDYTDYTDYKRAPAPDDISDSESENSSQLGQKNESLVSGKMTNAQKSPASAAKIVTAAHAQPVIDDAHMEPKTMLANVAKVSQPALPVDESAPADLCTCGAGHEFWQMRGPEIWCKACGHLVKAGPRSQFNKRGKQQ